MMVILTQVPVLLLVTQHSIPENLILTLSRFTAKLAEELFAN